MVRVRRKEGQEPQARWASDGQGRVWKYSLLTGYKTCCTITTLNNSLIMGPDAAGKRAGRGEREGLTSWERGSGTVEILEPFRANLRVILALHSMFA